MEPASPIFVRRLMAEILRLHRIPKVQVERIVGPILGLFLPDLLGPLLDPEGERGGFAVVSPEFPLKRSVNNQSTNVDWLVVHPGRGLVVLLELKTAPGSIESEQLDIYERVGQRVVTEGGAFLLHDLGLIARASDQRAKYAALLDECAPHEAALAASRQAVTLCLVPAGTRVPVGAQRLVRHFRDLPPSIGGELAADWPPVREALCCLDLSGASAPVATASSPMTPAGFADHVLANLHRCGEARTPVRFSIGNTGPGARPNYQVEFTDGSTQRYRYDGSLHPAPSFNPRKLDGPFIFPAGRP